jgi:hypothetical protein
MIKFNEPKKILDSDNYIIELQAGDANEGVALSKALKELANPTTIGIFDHVLVQEVLNYTKSKLLVGDKRDWSLLYKEVLPSGSIVVRLMRPEEAYSF